MIFATVGTQLPFDRLLTALDAWAAQHPETKVVAQTGDSKASYPHLTCHAHLDAAGFADHIAKAKVVVAHAGMGTILQTAEAGKSLILLPRRAAFGEHRNDHQLATAAEMAVLSNVTVADEAADVAPLLNAKLADAGDAAPLLPATASARLLDALKDFIWSEETQPRRVSRRRFGWVRA